MHDHIIKPSQTLCTHTQSDCHTIPSTGSANKHNHFIIPSGILTPHAHTHTHTQSDSPKKVSSQTHSQISLHPEHMLCIHTHTVITHSILNPHSTHKDLFHDHGQISLQPKTLTTHTHGQIATPSRTVTPTHLLRLCEAVISPHLSK